MQGGESAKVLDRYMNKNPENPKNKEIRNKFMNLFEKSKDDIRSQELLHNIATKSI